MGFRNCVIIALFIWLLSCNTRDVFAARGSRHSTKQGQFGARNIKGRSLNPPVFNLATNADIIVNATCGEDGPETFCKLADSLKCSVCDSLSHDPGKKYDINNVLTARGKGWQSPTLARGDQYEYVTITIDLKQVYQVEYVILKSGNSARPASWILERSLDGETFEPWQYYAANNEECWTRYSVPPVSGKPIYTRDDEVICTSFHSRRAPLENGQIHTHLVNGRPGAFEQSSTIQYFTRARFIRLRFQGLHRNGDTIADKRRAFYSVKEINIMGRCVCSGHASRCKFNAHHGRQECDCERHTCGEGCEKCCPMYNQVPWKPGITGQIFHCEKCNCHGHATSCQYDAEVELNKKSLDIRGKYSGGGVCLNCTDNTEGINCEKCKAGYYRPSGVLPSAPNPCLPCDCDNNTSTGHCVADDSLASIGKIAGACECKAGFAGYKCDECAAGFRQFPKCTSCPCDPRGIRSTDDCEGDCVCKENVVGEFCDRCAPGYFDLTKDNPKGCVPCDCFGVTNECRASRVSYSTISTLDGWLVTDMNASRTVAPFYNDDTEALTIMNYDVYYDSPYWLAPKLYGSNRLSSYGSNITYRVTWEVMRGDTSGNPNISPNVIIVGRNGMRIAYGEESFNGQEAEISVPLHEQGWYHVRSEVQDIATRYRRTEYRGDVVTRSQMLRVLADVKHILIRAQYHSEQIEGSLNSVVLSVGTIDEQQEGESLVELCLCPEGYSGSSCEDCAWGYVKVEGNSSNPHERHVCIKCDCHNHAGSCDLFTNECKACIHNTFGSSCEKCALGYYGDATRGTPNDCKQCACPLHFPSNNFSPTCQLEDPRNISSTYICTQCPRGYTGDHCESCDFGYFGNPTVVNGTCESCNCNGGACDVETGQCLECHGNTEGWKCDKCKEAHFGNPLERNCMPCECSEFGSSSDVCDPVTGQCSCTGYYGGRDCSRCIEGYGNVTAGCRMCDCDIGASSGLCDQISGACNCKSGVVGIRCDVCAADHYGYSIHGCLGCQCSSIGSSSSTCDIVTGQCSCKPHVIGRQCDRCQRDYWGLSSGAGCTFCDCDHLGSYNSTCDRNTGNCYCKPGVGGSRCNSCLPGYYGFSKNGCQRCEICNKPGHICDPNTGQCVCPPLTYGENCDRCRAGSFDLRIGVGCRPCDCTLGSTKTQCLANGQCPCRDGFDGRRCERCADGYHGYPRCRPCNCDPDGTLECSSGLCHCDENGQCPCKENVYGKKCNSCQEGTFGLSKTNPKGCTECFCFGKSTLCQQGDFSWSKRKLIRPRFLHINNTVDDIIIIHKGLMVPLKTPVRALNLTNGLTVIPWAEGDVIFPPTLFYNYPLYWQLPASFLGDKVISYGGFLRFVTTTEGGALSKSNSQYPLVQMQGNQIVLEYYSILPSEDNNYRIRFHESLWQLQNKPEFKVTREILMMTLQNVQHLLVKASDYVDFTSTALLEASMDAAMIAPTRTPISATSVEICECPVEYNGTSCQDPNIGFYRWFDRNTTVSSTIIIDIIGKAKACSCNGRSNVCDRETGYCLNCAHNTAGPDCDVCAEGFYGDPEGTGCQPCPCPTADKQFSSACSVYSETEVKCHCKPGYTGKRCERCAFGYYGMPSMIGGSCVPCDCHPGGSASDECDEETGQCNCKPGSTGRDCSQCSTDRHVLIEDTCTFCEDNCTSLLLDDLALVSKELIQETYHIANGYIPLPFEDLSYISGNATELMNQIEEETELKRRIERVPWLDYKRLSNDADALYKTFSNLSTHAENMKSQCFDSVNNAYSINIELLDLKKKVNEIVLQLMRYGNDDRKIEVKNALQEASAISIGMKFLNLTTETKKLETILHESKGYIDWFNSQYNATGPVSMARDRIQNYTAKLDSINSYVSQTEEMLFEFKGLYNEATEINSRINKKRDNLVVTNEQVSITIGNATNLLEITETYVNGAKHNLENLPGLRDKLVALSENLSSKENSYYNLNYEYKDKYVITALEHAANLTDYVDQYVGLFEDTRTRAASPLKASQAYKNILDGLHSAKHEVEAAREIVDDVYLRVYDGNPKGRSMLDSVKEILGRHMFLFEQSNDRVEPVTVTRTVLDAEKHGVKVLKDTLNSTGVKDNEINVRLREWQSESKSLQEDLETLLRRNQKITAKIHEMRKKVDYYWEGVTTKLKPELHELKREGDSKISLASEKLAEAQSNIKRADSKLISLANASSKRQIEFVKWNGTLTEKIRKLKNKIAEARNTADGIRVSLKSAKGKRCVRSYRYDNLQPTTTNSIKITLTVCKNRQDGTLFYLPSSITGDFLAIDMLDRKIRFLWNVGGGTGYVTHPEILETGSVYDESSWYQIEANRNHHVATLSVRKQISTTGKFLPVLNKTSAQFGRFDVAPTDRIWIGGIPDYPDIQRQVVELVGTNGLAGCVHQVVLDDRQIGLHNFVSTTGNNACEPCVEGVETVRDDLSYHFNGEGYALRNRVSSGPYNKYNFGVSLNFRSFDQNALLFLAIDPQTDDYVMLSLRDAKVVLQIRYGGNVSLEMVSAKSHNTGQWTKVDAYRQFQLEKNTERCILKVGSENDQKLGAPNPQPRKDQIPNLAKAKYYFGGVPPSFESGVLDFSQKMSFLGCMSNIYVKEGYDPMAEQFYGVEPSCSQKPVRIVGFHGDGYLEHAAFSLKKISSTFGFTFRTTQTSAMILLSTFRGQEDRLLMTSKSDRQLMMDNYYSAVLLNGQVQIRLNAGKGEVILQTNETYNDGKYHSVVISKKRKDVELRVDDTHQASGRLPSGAAIKAPEFNGGLYFGGLPSLINDTSMVTTCTPLYGAIKDVFFDDQFISFDKATVFEHALIGRSGPDMGKEASSYPPISASLARSLSTQPEGCQKMSYYSLEPGALKFGDKMYSHTQLYLNFKRFWDKKYSIEFDFRTYYPDGLLFITPGIKQKHYFAVMLQDGFLSVYVKNRQKKEMILKHRLNDGNWHHITINHIDKKLTLLVDSQKPKTIKVPRKIGLASMMYIGGLPESGTPLPEQVVARAETLKGCIKGLRINGNIYDMVGSTSRAYNVGQCFPNVESGAYFQDDAYAVYDNKFNLGPTFEIELEFRTSETTGVLMSSASPAGSPALSLELNNGKIIMSSDFPNGEPISIEQNFASPYSICDNRWHRVHATYNHEGFALKVDDLEQKYNFSVLGGQQYPVSFTSPLYIGGIPASVPTGSLINRDHFNGCMRNIAIEKMKKDWTGMMELHNIHLSSCPVQ